MNANPTPSSGPLKPNWARQRDIAFAIIGWFIVVAIVLWVASHIVGSLLVLILAALLAYALFPVVRFLSRYIPRALAILLVYLAVVCAFGALSYLIVNTAVAQVGSLTHQLNLLLRNGSTGPLAPLLNTLKRFGISQSQLQSAGQRVIDSAQGAAASVVPLLAGIFSGVLDVILVAVLSIYLLADGERVVHWLKTETPIKYRGRVGFTLTMLERVVGGYIRGQFILSSLIGVLVGVGMAALQVPYAVLLGVIAFILEFIPIVGVFVSGALCVLVAVFSHSFIWAIFVLAYFVFVHVIEGDVVGPRIVGRAVGVHPAVSIFALLAGAELFGIWGALFASPLAGVTQAVLAELWREWRDAHANQFPEEYGPPIVPVTTAEALNTPQASLATVRPMSQGREDMDRNDGSDAGATMPAKPIPVPPDRSDILSS